MDRDLKNARPKSGVTVKNAKAKLALVDGEFTVIDLKKEMDKRKVFGSYNKKHIYKIINKGQKCNLIKRVKAGYSAGGEQDIFKKLY